ncbi:MAG TPA: transposase [Pyrinomonadaceae bacterium]
MGFKDDPHKDLLREAGWHTRGYLPHFDGCASPQTITLHLADSVPTQVIENWRRQLRHLDDQQQLIIMQQRIERYADQGYGECFLKEPPIAKLVQDSLLKYDGIKYDLLAWCVMPNHEHSLLTRHEDAELEEIMQAHKSYTAHEANKILKRKGRFWLVEYHDRMIRNSRHYNNAIRYIENNPVKARLCAKVSDWPYSSAWFRARGGCPGSWR